LQALDILHVHISQLLTGLVVHSYVPNEHCLAVLLFLYPRVEQTDVTDSTNYRGIALRFALIKFSRSLCCGSFATIYTHLRSSLALKYTGQLICACAP